MPIEDKDTLFARWLNNDISEEELAALKESGDLDELTALVKATEGLQLKPYNAQQAYDKYKAQQHAAPQQAKSRRLSTAWAIGIAASVALLIAFLIPVLFSTGDIEIVAERGANTSHSFADGSEVALNDDSKLNYTKKYGQENRLIQLSGEAFFKIKKGTPFIVETANGTVTVLGTEFNVRARANTLDVVCYTGKVAVSKNEEQEFLEAGQSLKVKDGRFSAIIAVTEKAPSWKNGSTRYENEPLHEILEEFERQYDVKVVKPQQNPVISGQFYHNSLEKEIDKICKQTGLGYTFTEDQKTIIIESKN